MELDKELHIIYVEDVVSDAMRVEHALRKQKLHFKLHRVDTREDFLAAVSEHPPDIVLSDHGLPSFDGFSALALTREVCPNAPFIFVTSALTADMDLEKLVGEVADYISKSRLELLAPAIIRAFDRAEKKRTTKLSREERANLIRRLLLLLADTDKEPGLIPVCSDCRKVRIANGQWQPSEQFFRDQLHMYFTHGLCDKCLPKYFQL
jgi:DNA-binding NtrC family response regulator